MEKNLLFVNERFFLDERQRPSIQLTVPKSTNWWIFNRNSRKIIISLEEIDSWNLCSNNKNAQQTRCRSQQRIVVVSVINNLPKNSHSKLFLWIERLVPRNENNQKNEVSISTLKKTKLGEVLQIIKCFFLKIAPFFW